MTWGHAPGMHWSRESEAGARGHLSFPDLLAEYGRLAAELPEADIGRGEQLRQRLSELDEQIDHWAQNIGTDRV